MQVSEFPICRCKPFVAACFTALALSAQAELSLEPKASSDYYTNLRLAYAKQKGGMIGWVSDDERKALLKLFNEDKPLPFIEAARKWLSKCPVDAEVHVALSSLLMKSGDAKANIFHRSAFFGLLNSIASSGDGQSERTAYKVISVDEEYVLLRYLGAELKQQSLQGSCDVMEVKLDNKTSKIYFDASIPLQSMQKLFESNSPK